MELDWTWLVLGLPLAFALGWAASRLDLRQWRRETREHPRAYYKGLNLLLNEQQDKAIDAFIEAVQDDPDATELHFALGNLFRRRGEFERAIRVHEHLLRRGDLSASERDRAQFAIAQDYAKAGLFDRAESAYSALTGTPYQTESQLALLGLHERSRDWRKAIDVAWALEKAGAGAFATRVAHYWCELAAQSDAKGLHDEGSASIEQAKRASQATPRPHVQSGQRHAAAGRAAAALEDWLHVMAHHPNAAPLIAREAARCALQTGGESRLLTALQRVQAARPNHDVTTAIGMLMREDVDSRSARLTQQLAMAPTLTSVADVLKGVPAPAWSDATRDVMTHAVERAARPLQRYRCAACGFEAAQYFWQCPGCLGWDSFPPLKIEEL